MRILVLLPSLTDLVGGIQTYSQALITALSEIGGTRHWQVEVLGLHDQSPSAHHPFAPGVLHRGFSGQKWKFALASIRASRNADVIILAHANFASLLHAFRMVAPQASCCVAAHGIEVWRKLSATTRSALQHAAEIWCVSEFTQRQMLAFNPDLAGLSFQVLPNTLGPRPNEDIAVPAIKSQLGQLKTVLCVSRMSSEEPYKNVDLLIRAFKTVKQQVPDARLVLIGPGDDRLRLQAIVDREGLRDVVSFTGRIPDAELQRHLAACEIFALPSTGEGFGIVFLEAMYHAKPCIGAATGGVPEVIAHGKTGLLVSPDDPQTLSAALIRLLGDAPLRKSMGDCGRERYERLFSPLAFRRQLATRLGVNASPLT